MNILHMIKKQDAVLACHPDLQPVLRDVAGAKWAGLRLPDAAEPQIVLHGFARYHPFRTRPAAVGWMAQVTAGTGSLAIRIAAGDAILSTVTVTLTEVPFLIPIPWPVSAAPLPADARLELLFRAEGGKAELLVHRRLDRAPLLALARGRGIEIGPGPKPQVLSGPGVEVSYVEEMPPEEWDRLYNQRHKVDIAGVRWDQYHLGKAADLPAEEGSLDFIFSSHVFEHLANPLGHLRRWSGKLRPGGVVLAVVPDIACGNKDYEREPARLSDLIAELEADLWAPTMAHYLAAYATSADPVATAQRLIAERFSIHAHVYSREAIAAVLGHACAAGWFSGFHLIHSPNHKDFHFVCCR